MYLEVRVASNAEQLSLLHIVHRRVAGEGVEAHPRLVHAVRRAHHCHHLVGMNECVPISRCA